MDSPANNDLHEQLAETLRDAKIRSLKNELSDLHQVGRKLTEERDAMKRRAEGAESDGQRYEAEIKRLQDQGHRMTRQIEKRMAETKSRPLKKIR